MDHILILSYLVIILAGAWSAFVARHLYRTRSVPLLRHFFNYIVCFNTMVLGYLVANYAFTNVIGWNPANYPPSLFAITALPIFAIHVGVSWTALRLAENVRRQAYHPLVSRSFIAVVVLIGISYTVGITLLLKNGALLWLVRTHAAVASLMVIVTLAAFLSLAAGRLRSLENHQKRPARRLGWYLFCGHLALAASVALTEPGHLIVATVVLLWLNCVPLIWLRSDFRLYHQTSTEEEGEAIAALAQTHGITQREREVMELIVLGKSNKEIEDQLCISFSTVKNHAYNLYRKLDVTSRTQLIYLVMTSIPQHSESTGDNGQPSFLRSRTQREH